ncbi:proteasome pci domain-containing, partial [Cystoisospora suis]
MVAATSETPANGGDGAPAASSPSSQGGLAMIKRMSPYWDSHMTAPVLDWMVENEMITADESEKLKRELLGEMATTPEGRAVVEEEIRELEKKLTNFNEAIEAYKKEQQKRIGGYPDRKSVVELSEWWTTSAGQSPTPPPLEIGVDALVVQLGKLHYSVREYKKAVQQLQYMLTTLYELLVEGTNIHTRMACYWGVCASIILLHQQGECRGTAEEGEKKEEELIQQLDGEDEEGNASEEIARKAAVVEAHGAAQCILKLGDILDQISAASNNKKDQQGNQISLPPSLASLSMNREEQLLHRSWLLHWAIWPLFRYYFLVVHTKQFVPRNQAWSSLIEWMLHE